MVQPLHSRYTAVVHAHCTQRSTGRHATARTMAAEAVLDGLLGDAGDGLAKAERERYLGRLASLDLARIAAEPQLLKKE